jgi:hypothetical protein
MRTGLDWGLAGGRDGVRLKFMVQLWTVNREDGFFYFRNKRFESGGEEPLSWRRDIGGTGQFRTKSFVRARWPLARRESHV